MSTPYAIFCADPLSPRSVDPAYQVELEAARLAGFTPVRLDHDELDHRVDPDAALRTARFDGEGKAVYRGWMLADTAYSALFEALKARHVELVTPPEAYVACHHAPGSYPALRDWMPQTAWVPTPQVDDVTSMRSALSAFGSSPVILKDWVKSQGAGYWAEACFIPDASNVEEVTRIVARFRELQGDSLVGGLVFKGYLPLVPVGSPAFECRAFVVGGRVAGCWPRSEHAQAIGTPPAELLDAVARKVPSPFASADFGRDQDGRWWLLEVGDGQVSGLPSEQAAGPMFEALSALMT